METFNFNQLKKFFAQQSNPTQKKKIETCDVDQIDGCVRVQETSDIITNTNEKLGIFEFRTKIVWFNAIGFLVLHLIGLYGTYLMLDLAYHGKYATFLWTIFLVFISGESITMGAHRLWTHKSYKANLILQILMIIGQTIAGENCCYIWARDHRQHHKYTDTDADPHNARRGFFFSHIGWLMMKKHPQVILKGKGIDMSDLEADPIIMFQKKYYKPLYILLAMIMPMAVPMHFWGESFYNAFLICFFARVIILLNITWTVNSIAHVYGTRPYDKTLIPVESTLVSLITMGEGWHNYHHAFPWDYKAAEFGIGLNGTKHFIELFAKIGWAYDLKEASYNLVKKKTERAGDGSHPLFGVKNKEVVADCGVMQAMDDETAKRSQDLDELLSQQLGDSYRQSKENKEQTMSRRNLIRQRHG